MCGIFGVWHINRQPVQLTDVEIARDTMIARGPDDAGAYVDGEVGLGHRRLAIVDLSPSGRMPMSSEDGSNHAVFNGEIYNFVALRRELEKHGHRFRGKSDSEVVLRAYATWGEDAFRRFDGMFAIGIWDRARRRVVLARDPAGEKPLYYSYLPGKHLVFGSSLAALTAYPGGPCELDRDALVRYASFGFVPGPDAILRGVSKVPPGTAISFGAERFTSQRFFSLEELALSPRLEVDAASATAMLGDALRESVRSRMVADVPVGAFLSGGVDSSLVVALMAQIDPGATRTFTIGFREHAYDESPYAQAIARHLGVENTTLFLSSEDVLREVDAVSSAFDEPMADFSALPTLAVSRLARRHATVVLAGDGGDEAFAGYRYYAATRLVEQMEVVPAGPRRLVRAAARWLPRGGVLRILSRASAPDVAAFFGQSGFYRGPVVPRGLGMILPDLAHRPEVEVADYVRALQARGVPSATEAGLLWDATRTLPDAWLCKVDRASMAVSLEVRSPILAPPVLELAYRFPLRYRVAGLRRKVLLRRVLAQYIPDELFERPKLGFTAPMHRWLRRELKDRMLDTLSKRAILDLGVLDPEGVARAVREHLDGTYDHAQMLWGLIHLVEWTRARGELVRPQAHTPRSVAPARGT